MAEKDAKTGRFLSGNSGGGRPKGSRNKLGEQFLTDLQALWETDGAQVLEEARTDKPMEFAKMVAGLLPKELLVRTSPENEMSDAELADTLEKLGQLADQLRSGGSSESEASGGSETTPRLQ